MEICRDDLVVTDDDAAFQICDVLGLATQLRTEKTTGAGNRLEQAGRLRHRIRARLVHLSEDRVRLTLRRVDIDRDDREWVMLLQSLDQLALELW